MRFIAQLIAAGLALIQPTAAPAHQHNQAETVVIQGQFPPTIRTATYSTAPPALRDGWSNASLPTDIPIEVESDGSFQISLPSEGPLFLRVNSGAFWAELFVQPGYDLFADWTGSSVAFSGRSASANRTLQAHAKLLKEARAEAFANGLSLFALERSAFDEALEEVRSGVLIKHAALIKSQGSVPPLFSQRLRADIEYWFKDIQLNYPSLHNEITGQRAAVTDTYLEDIGRGHLDKTEFLSSGKYVNFVDAYIRLKSRGDLGLLHQDLPTELLLSRYRTLRDEPLSAPIRDFLLGEMFRNYTTSYGPRDWGRVLAQFTADSPEHPVAKQYSAIHKQASEARSAPDEIRIYKTADGYELEAHIFLPKRQAGTRAPSAFLFFHGGGWSIGSPEWGYEDCERMAALGMVAVSFEYRIADVHGTDIIAALEDVRSAIAWARSELDIDRDRVIAAGFSAGGHLAASSAILAFPEFGGADTRPNALVIQSSSYDLTKSSFFSQMTQGRPKEFSLTHSAGSQVVPSLFIHGRRDSLAPLREFQEFMAKMAEADSDFEYHVFNTGHFFRDAQVNVAVAETVRDFLTRRGFLNAQPDFEPQ